MKHVLVAMAVVLFLLPVVVSAAGTYKAQIDGSWAIRDDEGYGNAGGSSTFRLSKGNQHMSYMDFEGAAGLAGEVANLANPNVKAYVWVKSVQGLGNKAAIMTIRTSNSGNIVEDGGLGSANALTNMTGYSVPNSSGAVAFRMADLYNGTSYNATGNGVDKNLGSTGAFGGVAWKRPTTGIAGGVSSGGVTFVPGQECVQGTMPPGRTGFWGGEIYGVEAVLGGTWSQSSNTVARYTNAGQLVNQDLAGNFLYLDPATDAQADGWYRVELNKAIVLDMINNVENKGIVFTSYTVGATINWGAPAYGNDDVYSKDHQGGIYAPYLQITPEPATMILLALGGLVALRRRSA